MLDYHFVAFLDILGYSNMVKADLEGPRGEEKHFQKLLQLHKETTGLKYENLDFTIIQFSDSVIVSAPYNNESFFPFTKLIADYQFKLFMSGILIRGGITFGKHFYKNDFLFSSALIDAYHIESTLARFPRIIISDDLFDLVSTGRDCNLHYIISDNNYKIIDFINDNVMSEDNYTQINHLISSLENDKRETISDKGLWLKEYFNFIRPENSSKYSRFNK